MTDDERLRFMQGMHFACVMIKAGHDIGAIRDRMLRLGAAWGLSGAQYLGAIGEMVEDVLAAERRPLH